MDVMKMKIVVEKQELVDKINKAIVSYEKEYRRAVSLYLTKVEVYLDYLRKYAKAPSGHMKYPPQMPHWLRDNFVQTITALNAHTGETVEMNHNEYGEILHGIENLVDSVSADCNALIAYSV